MQLTPGLTRRRTAEKHFQQAVDVYTEAIARNPTSAVYFSNRAFAHIRLEEYGSAILDATQAITLDPKFVKAWPLHAVLPHGATIAAPRSQR